MRKKFYIVNLFLLGTIFFNFSFGFVNAFEGNGKSIYDENDGIDDDFEDLNKRDIRFEHEANEVHITSVRRNDTVKDYINIIIFYGEDGIGITVRYKPQFGEDSEFLLDFGVLFREIIEFVDIDEDGVFHPEHDKIIQEFPLNNFKDAFHDTMIISEDTTLHYFRIQTINDTFTAHFYFVEEFTIIENSLITPTQFKIDFEINNFVYLNESSQLALNTRLVSEDGYAEEKETEDEQLGYSSDEEGVITSLGNHTGFLTWKEKAMIDDVSRKISVSEILEEEYEQRLYFCYPRGEHIYHDPKVGIVGLLISPPSPSQFNPTFLILLIAVLAALSVSVGYVMYHGKHKFPAADIEKDRDEYFSELFDEEKPNMPDTPYNGRAALNLFDGEDVIEKLMQIGDINITILSEDFFEIINRFEWVENERSMFIGEMLALSPLERNLILKEMLAKSHA